MRGCKRKSNLRIMSLTMATALMMSSALGSSITVLAQENGVIGAAATDSAASDASGETVTTSGSDATGETGQTSASDATGETGQTSGSDAAGETGQTSGSDAAGETGQTSGSNATVETGSESDSDSVGENGQANGSGATEENGQIDVSESETAGNGDESASLETGNETENGTEETELPSEDNQEGNEDESILDDAEQQISEEEDLLASGITNEISWKIDNNGKLALKGNGDYALDGEGRTPWAEYSENIKSAEVNITGLTSAKNMFAGCSRLEKLDIEKLDTAQVTDMSNMFSGCYNLGSLDLSNFDTSKVTDMSSMFEKCDALKALDVSTFNTSKVTNMSGMFSYCEVDSLDLSNFDTSKVTDMSKMFSGLRSYNSDIDDIGSVSLHLSNFDTSQVTDMSEMFSDCFLESLDLSSFDTSKVTNMSKMFYGVSNYIEYCDYLEELDLSNFDTSHVTNMSEMFFCCSVKRLNLSSFNPSQVTDMRRMFSCCENLEKLDLGSFDTSSVTDMSNMFSRCYKLESLDLGSFDTSSVTDMSNMFSECLKLESLDLSNFDTSNVINMERMFGSCESLRSIDLSSFDMGKANSADEMLPYGLFHILTPKNCNISIQLPTPYSNGETETTWKWYQDADTVHTTLPTGLDYSIELYLYENGYTGDIIASGITNNISWKIDKSRKLTITGTGDYDVVDDVLEGYEYYEEDEDRAVPPWAAKSEFIRSAEVNISGITSTKNMFAGCDGLKSIDLSKLDTSQVTDMSGMFFGCGVSSLDLSNFKTGKVTDMSFMFAYSELTSLDLSSFDTSNVTDMSGMFSDCENASLVSLDISSFDTSNVTNMSRMFSWCRSLKALDVSNFDTSNVTDMSDMFFYCSSLKNLELSTFNTSKVTNMSLMFYSCHRLSKLDLSSFDTGKVTNMLGMFACWGSWNSQLTDLDLSSFNTSNVTDMSGLFWNCSGLKELDLSNFDTSNVTGMVSMFYGCSNLRNLDVSSFNTENVKSMSSMFAGCKNLISLDLSSFSMHWSDYYGTDYAKNMLSGANSLIYICTPCSCHCDVPLPTASDAEKWYDALDSVCTSLPTDSYKSIELYKNGYPGDGTTKRMAYISGISIQDKTYDGEPAAYAGTAVVKDTYGIAIAGISSITYSYTGKLEDGSAYGQTAQAPIQAGKYTLTVTAENDTYSGRLSYSFDISPKEISISAGSVSIKTGGQLPALSELTYTVNGLLGTDKLTKAPKLKYSKNNISAATAGSYDIIPYGADAGNNYSIKYVNGTLAIEAGKPSYADKDDSSYTDAERKDLSEVGGNIANIKAKVYDGSEYEPALKVTATIDGRKKTLMEGTDYRVIYENNINAGTGTANVWGNGIYKGKISKTFTINAKPVKKLKVITGNVPGNISADSIADTSAALPVYIYDGSRLLTRGEDYNLSLKTSNAKALTLTVTGAEGSNYTGTGTAKLAIYDSANAEKVINPENVIIDGKTFNEGYETAYTGKAVKPAVAVKIGETTLTSRNYKLAYQNNKDAGTAYVIVTGKGEYKGKAVVPFSITSIQPQLTITNTIKDKTYNGRLQKPSVTVKAGNVKLKKNKDYTVAYTENLHAGTATVIVTGKGSYIGSVEKTFKINKQNIKKVSIKGTQKDGLAVYYGTRLLRKDSDYTLAYGGAKGKNKIEVTITAKEDSDFTGDVTKSVKTQ